MRRAFTGLELIFLFAGVSLPLVTIDEFWFFTSNFSILSLIFTLFQSGESILGALLVVFCVFIPFYKSFNRIISEERFEKIPLHKFAMIDMFLISFLIFGSKMSYFYEVRLEEGFYFLCAYLLMSYFSTILNYLQIKQISSKKNL